MYRVTHWDSWGIQLLTEAVDVSCYSFGQLGYPVTD